MTPHWASMVYLVFALGALGVYFLMPRAGRSTKAAGAVFALPALAGVLMLCANQLPALSGANVLFYVSASVALMAGVKVITHEKPVYSALYFVLVVLAITPLLILQSAEFLAIAMVIIYAGAILVTYVFVIMLAQQSGQPVYDRQAREPFMAVCAGFVTMAVIAGQITHLPEPWTATTAPNLVAQVGPGGEAVPEADTVDNIERVGAVMLSEYVVAFELAGVLLLVAMIGAIAVSRKRVPTDEPVTPAPPPGTIGREVPPF